MNNYLTEDAINILKEEIENRKIIIRKQINEDLKEARAHGDLSENFEYKAAKRERARNESRIRFLERMIKTAIIIKDTTASNEVGLNKYVTVKFLEDNYVQELYIVTTVEADPLEDKISIESPLGKSLFNKLLGNIGAVFNNAGQEGGKSFAAGLSNTINSKFNIKNIGFYKAKEVAEIYISNKNKELIVPKKELKAFKKVLLDVNESKEIEIKIPLSELSIFACDLYRFVAVNGTYEVLVGSSCLDIRLKKEFSIKNKENYKDNIDIDLKEKYKNIGQLNISSFDFYKLTNITVNEEKEAITIETPFSDFKKTKKGKFAYKLIFMIYKNLVIPKIARSDSQLNKIKDNNLRDSLIKNKFFLLSMFDHNCPRSIFMASNGATNYHQILGMVDLANGKYFRAIKNFLTKDK